MKVYKILRSLILIIPAFFFYLTFSSRDSFYLLLALISLVLALLFIFKRVLSDNVLQFPIIFKKFEKKIEHAELELVQSIEEEIKPISKKIKIPFFRLLIILLFNTVALLAVTLTTLPYVDNRNVLFAFYISLINEIKSSALNTIVFLIFLLGNLTLVFILLRGSKIKRIVKSLIVSTISLILAIHISLLISFVWGVGLTNYKVLGVKSNPEKVGLIWGKDKVKEKLQKMDNPPKIVGSDTDVESKIIDLILIGNNESKNFLKGNLLTFIPRSLLVVKLDIPDETLISYDKYLIITKINKEEIEDVSPTIARLFVEDYLNPRYIKSEPSVQLMGRQEYLKYRDDKINEQIEEIDGLIEEVQKNINILYSSIGQAKQKIAENEQGLSESIKAQEDYYSWCVNAGYYSYYFGTFYRYYSDEYCNSQRAEWDAIIAQFRQNINDWNNILAESQKALPEWQEWKITLEGVRELVTSQKESVPQELGIFEPERNVKVVLESTSTETLADFFTTLVHEYYHYSSYVSEERTLPYFFEEGLTEYFARKTIRENMDVQTQIGYPMITRIIEEMAEKIPESRLEEIYFTKNAEALVVLLNETYGTEFYSDSEFYFTAIYYSPVTDETVKFANNIMFKIGGEELNVEDLTSYRSKFE